jgi:predicted enzyme related to lactoylglutathione lyase
MSEREQYPAGVPCWVETLQQDPRAALDFYGPLFGWEFAGPGPMPGDPPGEYYVARVAGRDVAGIGSAPEPQIPGGAVWSTYVRVDSADAAAASAAGAGGALRDGPFDVLPAGRMAVLEDPAGAVVCVWEAAAREGAQLINVPRAWAMSLLETTDPDAACAFYGAMFGWQAEPVAPGAPIVVWRLPGYVGGEPEQPVPHDVVGAMSAVAEAEGGAHARWSVDFWVDDADGTAERAVALGGEVVVAPHDRPMFRGAVLADPVGATFSISQLTAVPRSG